MNKLDKQQQKKLITKPAIKINRNIKNKTIKPPAGSTTTSL